MRNTLLRELLRWHRPARSSAASLRWREWARGLLVRHGRQPGGRPATMLLKATAAGWPERAGQRSAFTIQLAPRFRLSFAASRVWRSADVGVTQVLNVPATPALAAAGPGMFELRRAASSVVAELASPVLPDPAPKGERRVVTRIVERSRRVELPPRWTGMAGSSAASSPGRPPGSLAPDGRLVPTLELAVPRRAPEADAPRGLLDGRQDVPFDARLPEPIDVERLTDEVVRHIDRRIVAQRERFGRI